MNVGGSTSFSGDPSDTKTDDYDNLVKAYTAVRPPVQNADWESEDKCRWSPPVVTKAATEWITECSNLQGTWTTTSRNGAVCSAGGAPCEVAVSSKVGTTEKSICGFVDAVKGGAACVSNADCGLRGLCTGGTCECLGCYTGPTCNVRDSAKCAELSSSDSAPLYIATFFGIFVAVMTLVFTMLMMNAKQTRGKYLDLKKEFFSQANNNAVFLERLNRGRQNKEREMSETISATTTSM